jgi:hypothetical protein
MLPLGAHQKRKRERYRFEGKYRDILTSEVFDGGVSLSPYAVRVLMKI